MRLRETIPRAVRLLADPANRTRPALRRAWERGLGRLRPRPHGQRAGGVLGEALARRCARRMGLLAGLRFARRTLGWWLLAAVAVHAACWARGRAGGPWAYPVAAGALAVVSGVVAWLRRPSPLGGLLRLDERLHNHDRFSTAFEFASGEAPSPMQLLHLESASEALRRWPPAASGAFPLASRPLLLRAAGAVLVAVALCAVEAWTDHRGRRPDALDPATQEGLRREAPNIAEMLRRLEELAQKHQDPKLKKLLAEAREIEKELKKEGGTRKETLQEMDKLAAALSQQAEALRDETTASAETEKALQELAAAPELGNLVRALRGKDYREAAGELRKFAGAAEKGEISRSQSRRLAERVEAAAGKLPQSSALRRAAGNLAGALARDPRQAAQPLSEMARALDQAQRSGERAGALESLAHEARVSRQNVGAAGLRAAAAGRPAPAGGATRLTGGPAAAGGHSPWRAPGTASGDARSPGAGRGPGNLPGAFSSLFGGGKGGLEAGVGSAESRMDPTRVETKGKTLEANPDMSGEGPDSLVAAIQGMNASGRAGQAYREVYAEQRKLAEEALHTERIPAGRRDVVRSYFESIKPGPAETR